MPKPLGVAPAKAPSALPVTPDQNGAKEGASPGAEDDEDLTYLDTICDTPMVRLRRSLPKEAQEARVLAKLEMQNPGGSIKDRIALGLITGAEAAGRITPGRTTVVEYTSGNTAIGLAMVCAAKGYNCVLVMPQLPVMMERYMICRSFGAEVHLTAAAQGVPGMQRHVEMLLRENPDYWCPHQFNNQMNPFMHEGTTGPEIWRQAKQRVDYFIAGVALDYVTD
jgi:cysteine synthase A